MYLTITSGCVGENTVINIPKVYGTKFTGIKLGRRIGFPTINIMVDTPLQCGIYDAKSHHGPATIIVGKSDQQKAFVNFMTFTNEMDSINRFEFWDLNRIINRDSDFVSTFNRGCCVK